MASRIAASSIKFLRNWKTTRQEKRCPPARQPVDQNRWFTSKCHASYRSERTYKTEDADVFVVAQVERREAEEKQESHQNLKESNQFRQWTSKLRRIFNYQKDSHDDGIGAEPGNGVRGLLLDGGRDEDAVHDDLLGARFN